MLKTLFKIFLSKYIWMTLTFRVTWSHNWEGTSSCCWDN